MLYKSLLKNTLNQKHFKWVEYMHNFTFVLKHISGSINKVEDALRRRCLILQELQVNVWGFDHLKAMYKNDANFKAYEACKNIVGRYRIPWMDTCCKKEFCSGKPVMLHEGELQFGNEKP